MIVQDIFKNIDINKLINALFNNYPDLKDDYSKWNEYDLFNLISDTIDDLLNVKPNLSDDFVFVHKVYDNINERNIYLSPSVVYKKDLFREKSYIEKQYLNYSFNKNNNIFNYSLFLMKREDILGFQFSTYSFDLYDRYDIIAVLFYELTLFGFDNETFNECVQDSKDDLDKRILDLNNKENFISFGDVVFDLFGDVLEQIDLFVPSKDDIDENIMLNQKELFKHYYFIVNNLIDD